MKKLINLLFLLVCFFVISACSGSGPESVTINFMEGMHAGDFDEAKKYATTGTKSMLSMMESFGVKDQMVDEMKNEKLKFKVIDTKITDDRAVCTVKVSSNSGEKDEELPITLLKKDGDWKVDMDKESMNKEDMDMDQLNKEDDQILSK